MPMLNIITILKKNDGWISIKKLTLKVGIRRTNINRRINQMHKYGIVEIITDGVQHFVRLKKNK